MVSYLLDSMENLSDVSSSLRRVLKCVADLFVLWGIVEDSGSFLEVTNDFLDKKFVSKSDNVMKLVIEMILAQMKRLTTLTFIPSDKQTRTNKRTTKVMMYPALSSVEEKPAWKWKWKIGSHFWYQLYEVSVAFFFFSISC